MPISTIERPRFIYHTGIGGAGNYRKLSALELSTPSPAPIAVNPKPAPFYGGRGGAGNFHTASERAMFSFDEELERDRIIRENAAPIYSVGRGGVGNIVSEETGSFIAKRTSFDTRFDADVSEGVGLSTSTGSRYSTDSTDSTIDRFLQKLRRRF